jgi:hypothetical protein
LKHLKNLIAGRVPYLGLELTMHVIKSQIHLVRQSLQAILHLPKNVFLAHVKLVHERPTASGGPNVSPAENSCSISAEKSALGDSNCLGATSPPRSDLKNISPAVTDQPDLSSPAELDTSVPDKVPETEMEHQAPGWRLSPSEQEQQSEVEIM